MTETRHTEQSQHRLRGLDFARYLAFVGMVVVNFKIAMGAEASSGVLATLTTALEGRAAATFVVLAGIGLGLSALRDAAQTVSLTIKRALFLLALGLLNMTVFDADILHYYAVYFVFGVLLLRRSTTTLVAVILALNLASVVMILTLNYDAGWNWEDYSYADFWTPTGFIRNLFFNGWHPVIPWLGFLLFGIMLSRLSLDRRATQITLILTGAAALVSAEALGALLIPQVAQIDPELASLVTTAPIPPMPLYTLAGMGAACIVVGASLRAAEGLAKLGILQIFTPAGRQTLTLYIAHILIGMGTLEALDMLGGQTVAQAVWAALLFSAAAIIYALIWSKWFKRGPIEALMRRLAG